MIRTARLTIRRIAETDADFMVELLCDPGFVANIGDRGVRTYDDALAYVRERIVSPYERHGFGMELVVLTATEEPIGIAGFVKRETLAHPDLGFAFLQRHTGRGYGIEAARALLDADPRATVFALTAPHNTASQRLLEKLGFERRGHWQPPGEARTVYLFERTL